MAKRVKKTHPTDAHPTATTNLARPGPSNFLDGSQAAPVDDKAGISSLMEDYLNHLFLGSGVDRSLSKISAGERDFVAKKWGMQTRALRSWWQTRRAQWKLEEKDSLRIKITPRRMTTPPPRQLEEQPERSAPRRKPSRRACLDPILSPVVEAALDDSQDDSISTFDLEHPTRSIARLLFTNSQVQRITPESNMLGLAFRDDAPLFRQTSTGALSDPFPLANYETPPWNPPFAHAASEYDAYLGAVGGRTHPGTSHHHAVDESQTLNLDPYVARKLAVSENEDVVFFSAYELTVGTWYRALDIRQPELDFYYSHERASFIFWCSHLSHQFRIVLPLVSITKLLFLHELYSDEASITISITPTPPTVPVLGIEAPRITFEVYNAQQELWYSSMDWTENYQASKLDEWILKISSAALGKEALQEIIAAAVAPETLGRSWDGRVVWEEFYGPEVAAATTAPREAEDEQAVQVAEDVDQWTAFLTCSSTSMPPSSSTSEPAQVGSDCGWLAQNAATPSNLHSSPSMYHPAARGVPYYDFDHDHDTVQNTFLFPKD